MYHEVTMKDKVQKIYRNYFIENSNISVLIIYLNNYHMITSNTILTNISYLYQIAKHVNIVAIVF